MSEENKAIVRRLFEEILVQGNLDAVHEIFTADYHDHDPANEEDVRGPEGVRQEVAMYRGAFPDLQFTLEDQLADGDQVVTRWTFRATHQGELMGVAPTGNEVRITGITISRIAGGKIQEGWWNWDTLGMMRQIGAIPEEQPVS